MKTLFLVIDKQRVILEAYYDAICKYLGDCELLRVSKQDEAALERYFNENIEVEKYDRVILFLRFRVLREQMRFLKSIPNLVIIEHDAYQNYTNTKYGGAYSKFYNKIPWVKVICTGATLASKLRSGGYDVTFAPKAYDDTMLSNKGVGLGDRPIELGFVGSTGSKTYNARNEMLASIVEAEGLQICQTKSGPDYCDKLNEIRFFVGADVGFGEYMIKNFEAMACGCVLFTYSQGDEENETLGLVDMENVVLYQSLDELREKLDILRKDPDRAAEIAKAGQEHVERSLTWDHAGKKVAEIVQTPVRRKKEVSGFLGIGRRYVLDSEGDVE